MTERPVTKVLVFPAGTEIAFEIHAALKNAKNIELYGATSVPCHAEMVFKRCEEGLPFVGDPALVDALNACIDKYSIDYVYPAHDSVLLELTEKQGLLHAMVVTSRKDTVRICRSKSMTYHWLYDRKAWYLPEWYECPEDVDTFPVFAKPSVGQGAEGAMKADDREALDRVPVLETDYIFCEYLPGQEITVDCFTDRHGKLRYIGQRTRDRIRSGIAVRSHLMPLEESVEKIAKHLNEAFDFNGAWFFQLKEDRNGKYKLLEVAPRIAGTMGLTRNIGVNMPLLTLYNMMGTDVEILSNRTNLLLDRAFVSRFKMTDIKYDKVYVDYDDTLVLQDGKVNTMLLVFLYQAKDDGKKLILLTRHDGNIFEDLKEHNIDLALFDSLILLGKNGRKADYVDGKAIFIDDSFAERKSVWGACQAPVFDLDMVESLLDWRV